MRVQRAVAILMVLAVSAAPLWAVGSQVASQAVEKAFPAMAAEQRAHLAALLVKLAEGQVLVVGLGDLTASFTVGKDTVAVEVHTGLPSLAGLPVAAPQAAAGQGDKPWEREGTKPGDEIIGPDGGTYVWVPEGLFTMGSTEEQYTYQVKHNADSNWMQNEKPAHSVTISKGFWLGRCEVTNAQYRKFCEAAGVRFPPESDQGEDHPMVGVNWAEARAYCRQLGMRLPTEAEWEYAARGAEGRWYPWGDQADEEASCNRANTGPGGATFPVGTFPEGASWCGALDMSGNVWEWCADRYDPAYYAASPAVDPLGPAVGELRVFRGGSCRSYPWQSRGALRNKDNPESRITDRGFRAVISPR